jgi:hypothetical protein
MTTLLLRRLAAAVLATLLSLGAAAQDCPPPFSPPAQAELVQLARDAQDRGFLWAIEKDGVTSHLYGTLHAQKLAWFGPGPRLRQALQAAQGVALELDPTDPTLQAQLATPPADAASATPTQLPDTLPEALHQRLQARMQAECLDAPARQALQRMAPEMQLAALALLVARRDGLEAAFGSEVVLAYTARALNKPVHALETVAEQVRALRPGSAAQSASGIEQGLNDLDSGAARHVLARLAAAWAASDDAPLRSYADWCQCLDTEAARAQMKRLLDERNPLLAERIDALHAARGPLLVGVGALHMFGPAGLPALLQARGFKVTRVF